MPACAGLPIYEALTEVSIEGMLVQVGPIGQSMPMPPTLPCSILAHALTPALRLHTGYHQHTR